MSRRQVLAKRNINKDAARLRVLTATAPAPVGAVDHGSLSGLGDDDHSQYLHISSVRTITAQHSFSPGTTQAPFVLGANAQGQTVTGLKADLLDQTITTSGGTMTVTGALTSGSSVNFDVATGHAFVWTDLHTFTAGAKISTGQTLQFGADASLKWLATNSFGPSTGDTIQSGNYQSGISGWGITGDGDAEFANAIIRGELRASVFTYGLIQATAGSLIISKSAGKLSQQMVVPGSGTWTMYIDNPLTGYAGLFASGDIIRCKGLTGTGVLDTWFTVDSPTNNGDGTQYYTCTYASGSRPATFEAGQAVIDYGTSGYGVILQSADGTIGSTANISIATHAGAPWTTQTLRARLGNLNGSYGASGTVYGIGLGDYTGGNYLRYGTDSTAFVMKAGGGSITLDAGGLGLTSSVSTSGSSDVDRITWEQTGTGVIIGRIASYRDTSGDTRMWISSRAGSTGSSTLTIGAASSGGSIDPMTRYDISDGGLASVQLHGGDRVGITTDAGAGSYYYMGEEGYFQSTGYSGAYNWLDAYIQPRKSRPPSCRASRTTSQSIPNNSSTPLELNAEAWDYGGFHDGVTNNNRFTIPSGFDGVYLMVAQIEFEAGADGVRSLGIRRSDGQTFGIQSIHSNDTGQPVRLNASVMYYASAGTWFEATAYQNSGSALNVTYQSAYSPWFAITRIF